MNSTWRVAGFCIGTCFLERIGPGSIPRGAESDGKVVSKALFRKRRQPTRLRPGSKLNRLPESLSGMGPVVQPPANGLAGWSGTLLPLGIVFEVSLTVNLPRQATGTSASTREEMNFNP